MNNWSIEKSQSRDVGLKEILLVLKEWMEYLKPKWILIVLASVLGMALGFMYAYVQKVEYTAKLTFALEEEKGSGGISSAMGLASTLGIDLGNSAGGAFSGANLIELMKSRTIVERAFLNPVTIGNQTKSLIQLYIEFNKLNETLKHNVNFQRSQFLPGMDRRKFSHVQDSLMGKIYETFIAAGGPLNVIQKDKKVSIITIEVKSINEIFAKEFAESIAKEVSEFYIDTKIRKSKANVEILQKQVDSIRKELNAAITGVAIANDNTFNLNPATFVPKTSGLKRQIDVQANTAILTQLVTNLEMAKISLRKETPLIQIIDNPILPLNKVKVSKLKMMLMGGILFTVFTLLFFICKRWVIRLLYT